MGVRDRLYADFLMPSRLNAYRGFLESVLGSGWKIVSVQTFWETTKTGAKPENRRFLVLRHDVDTDAETAREMWSIDRELGVESSYFFRLSTLDFPLMAEIAAGGSQVSYHYEELAAVAKRRGVSRQLQIAPHMPEARDRFQSNLEKLRAITSLPMTVVASHGDFVNRAIQSPNWLILDDPSFRKQVDVKLETYDDALLDLLPARYTDTLHPMYWSPEDPAVAVAHANSNVQILVHPRHWRVSRPANARDDLRRFAEGARFGMQKRWSRGPRTGLDAT